MSGSGVDWGTLFSSHVQTWGTPPEFVRALCGYLQIPAFDLDAAAYPWNRKAARYIAPPDLDLDAVPLEELPVALDALVAPWGEYGRNVFINPEYGRNVGVFIDAARRNALEFPIKVVCLTFMRSDTDWFQRNAWHAREWLVVKGRIPFVDRNGKPKRDRHGRKQSAPAPSVVLIFDGTRSPLRRELGELPIVKSFDPATWDVT